jgi:hypothetical protein
MVLHKNDIVLAVLMLLVFGIHIGYNNDVKYYIGRLCQGVFLCHTFSSTNMSATVTEVVQ